MPNAYSLLSMDLSGYSTRGMCFSSDLCSDRIEAHVGWQLFSYKFYLY